MHDDTQRAEDSSITTACILADLHDKRFEEICAAILRVAEIHDLIEQLVHEREVVSHRFLLESSAKVGLKANPGTHM